MKAALLLRPGRMVIEEVPDPEVGPADVRIAVGGVGLCGSDLSVFEGKWTAPSYPWIQGHEAFGTIDAVGEGVPTTRLGELVVIEPNIACGRCDQCGRGRSSACRARQSVGMNRQGALAERLVIPGRNAWPVEPRDETDLVSIEPLTVVETALHRLGTVLPTAALVVGAGAQGLLMCLALSRRGARVHVVDINPARVVFAATLGAEPAPADDEETRFELVVDTVGSPASMERAMRLTEIGGTLLVLGLDGRPFELSAQTLVRRQLVLRGSLTYDHPADFARVVGIVNGGEILPGRVVTDRYAFEDAERAFTSCAAAPGKTWIHVGAEPAI